MQQHKKKLELLCTQRLIQIYFKVIVIKQSTLEKESIPLEVPVIKRQNGIFRVFERQLAKLDKVVGSEGKAEKVVKYTF